MKFHVLYDAVVRPLLDKPPVPFHIIEGAPGMGKSSLARWLAAEHDVEVIDGRADDAAERLLARFESPQGWCVVDDFDLVYGPEIEDELRHVENRDDAWLIVTSRAHRDDLASRGARITTSRDGHREYRTNRLNRFHRYPLGLPNRADATRAVRDVSKEPSTPALDALLDVTGCHPSLLTRATERMELVTHADRARDALVHFLSTTATSYLREAVTWVFDQSHAAGAVLFDATRSPVATPLEPLDLRARETIELSGLLKKGDDGFELVAPEITAESIRMFVDREEGVGATAVANETYVPAARRSPTYSVRADADLPGERGHLDNGQRQLSVSGTPWRIILRLMKEGGGVPVSVAMLREDCAVESDTAIRSAIQQFRTRVSRESFECPIVNVPRRGYALSEDYVGRTTRDPGDGQSAATSAARSASSSSGRRAPSLASST